MWAVMRTGYHMPPGESRGIVSVCDTRDDADVDCIRGDKVVQVIVRTATAAEVRRSELKRDDHGTLRKA